MWLTDITEHPTGEGKLYLCAVKDVFSNRIVGYSIDTRMKSSLAVCGDPQRDRQRAPEQHDLSLRSRQSVSLQEGHEAAQEQRLSGSMGRVGAAGDNASMESFYSLLQKNVLNTRRWATRDDLRQEIVYWIETKYNRRRRQRALGRLTPVEFEAVFASESATR